LAGNPPRSACAEVALLLREVLTQLGIGRRVRRASAPEGSKRRVRERRGDDLVCRHPAM
jgi:hypothetical protein